MNIFTFSKQSLVVLAVAVFIGTGFMLLANTQTNASQSNGISCQLSWGGRTLADGTGLRKIGEGSNWSMSVSGLMPDEQFRLANTNLTGGGTTYSGFLYADANGNFSLYDNTTIQAYEYGVGTYATVLESFGSNSKVNCTPSFIIEDNTAPVYTPTPTPIVPTPTPIAPLSCRLSWGGQTEYDGTGVRKIGEGSDWSINVQGLKPNEQFRLANTNITNGGTTFNGFLTADSRGSFYLYDNTLIQGYEYGVGRYKTELQNSSGRTLTVCTPSFVIEAVNTPTPVPPTPTPIVVPPPQIPKSCNLTWGGQTEADGTGVRKIGEGSDWSISVRGLRPNEEFRLANTNITNGGTTYNSFLTADANGRFYLYDNTRIQGYEYGVGRYKTELQTKSGETKINCTPSFVIEAVNTPTPIPVTPTPTPVTPTPTPIIPQPYVDLRINGSDGPITVNIGGSANLTWTSTNANTCTVSSNPNTNWFGNRGTNNTSGESTGSINQNTTFTIICTNASGSISDSVSTYINDNRQQLTCTPGYQTANINQSVNFNASGGTGGNYNWYTSDSYNSSGNYGSSFSTSFNSAGSKIVTVSNGNQSAQCTVNVVNNNNGTGSLATTKRARNITQGGGEYSSISARPGDTIEFIVNVNTYNSNYNNNNNVISNVRVTDYMPSGLRYNSGSSTMDGSYIGDSIVSGGYYIGNVYYGRNIVIKYRATVENDSYFNNGTTTLTNSVRVNADNASTVNDSVTINVSRINTVITNSQVSVQKFGRNITRGENSELSSVTAYPEDTIEFIIKVKSLSNNYIYNINVRDLLPGGLNYINNTTSVDGVVVSDGITGGINIGTLSAYQEKTIKLSAKVGDNNYFSLGTTSLTNTVQVYADNISTLSAQVPVTVFKGKVAGISTVGKVPTGGETVLLASLISALMAWGLVMYGRTYFAQKRGVMTVISKHANDKNRFNFI